MSAMPFHFPGTGGIDMKASEFMTSLYGATELPAWLVLWNKQTKMTQWTKSVEDVDRYVARCVTDGMDCYFGVCLQAKPLDSPSRGNVDGAYFVPGVWADIDFAEKAHHSEAARKKNYPDRDSAMQVLAALPGSYTYLVATGGGVHPYWLFDSPFLIDSEAARQRIGNIARAWQRRIKAELQKFGFGLDSTGDLARVLRLPGSINTKQPGRVASVEESSGKRYPVELIEEWTNGGKPVSSNSRAITSVARRSAKPRIDLPKSATDGSSEAIWATVESTVPQFRLENLIEAIPEFGQLWAGHTHRASPSEYDMSLANHAINSGWTVNEAAALLVMFAKKHQPDHLKKLLRVTSGVQDYLALTIRKAQLPFSARKNCSSAANAPIASNSPKSLPASQPESSPDRPKIIVDNTQLNELTAQSIRALEQSNDPPSIFVRDGVPVRIVNDENGLPRIEGLDRTRVRYLLSESANFFGLRRGGKELQPTHPTLQLADNVLAKGSWNFPPLLGIIYAPVVRSDGTLLLEPGYDAQSRLIYFREPGLEIPAIPDQPTPRQVQDSRDLLLDLIQDFPFADDASRANALAILFSILLRPAIPGGVPLAIIDSPVQGTGKTLLATVLALIAVGSVSSESIPAGRAEEEWRKKVTSVLMTGAPFVLLDNFANGSSINSSSLGVVLTSDCWSDRLLGSNDKVSLKSRAVWVATGNNLSVGGDLQRRCYMIRLDADCAQPWKRTDFGIKELYQHTLLRRGELLSAALTVIRGWYAHGKPVVEVPSLGGFEVWTKNLGSLLNFAGVPGFLDNLDTVEVSEDDDSRQWIPFLQEWWKRFKSKPTSVADLSTGILESFDDALLPEAIVINRERGEPALRRSLGRQLSRLRGRVIDEKKIVAAGQDSHLNVGLWQLHDMNVEGNDAA